MPFDGFRFRCAALACTAALVLAAPASAVSVFMVDTFQSGVQGWTSGDVNPNPPVIGAGDGPAGPGDKYLLLSASGVQGPGGKLVAFAGPQWAGDYSAAGINALTLDARNFGATDLSLRLMLIGAPGVIAVSTAAVLLPAGSGWTPLRFAADAASFSGAGAAALAGVVQLRLFHGTDAVFPGPNVAARLGIDNVTAAVPEPAAALLFAAGLGILLTRKTRSTT